MTPERALNIVRGIVRDYPARFHDDMESAGNLAIARLGERATPRKLRSAIIDIIRTETGYRRTYGPGTGRPVQQIARDDPALAAQWADLIERVGPVLRQLHVEGMTRREIAARIGRTPSRVSQIEAAEVRAFLRRPRWRAPTVTAAGG